MKHWLGLPIVALSLLAAAVPASSQSPRPLLPLSPKAEQLVSDWRAFYAEQQALRATSPPKSLAEDFERRIALDQGVRKVFSRDDITAQEQHAIIAAVEADWQAIDIENDAFVKRNLPADGWFKFSRDGKIVSHNAWLIVQHSPDHAFQSQIAKAMAPLVEAGEASGAEYALLYDRTERAAGRLQRYGSQGVCTNGKLEIAELEDAARVDQWRREMGMTQSLAEYKQALGVGRDC